MNGFVVNVWGYLRPAYECEKLETWVCHQYSCSHYCIQNSNRILELYLQATNKTWFAVSLDCPHALFAPTSKCPYWLISIMWSTDTWISILLEEIECLYLGRVQIEPKFYPFIRESLFWVKNWIVTYKTGKGLNW